MEKPKLNFWQIWNMSFGFLGIQFGFALQNANVSRIFETLGANLSDIPILWIAAPTTGLLIQPIIGTMSDRTWNRLGQKEAVFSHRCDPGDRGACCHAEFPGIVGCGDDALGSRCFDKCFDGAVSCVGGRPASVGAANNWVCRAKFLHRHGGCHCVCSPVHFYKLDRCQ